MNKNPERPDNIDDLISQCFNPKPPKKDPYWEAQEDVLRSVFRE